MKKSSFETGRSIVKILAILSVTTCVGSLMAGDGTPMQAVLAIATLALFASIFGVLFTLCRCPHCGKGIYFGVWTKTVCPHCKRNLSTGAKTKGKR